MIFLGGSTNKGLTLRSGRRPRLEGCAKKAPSTPFETPRSAWLRSMRFPLEAITLQAEQLRLGTGGL